MLGFNVRDANLKVTKALPNGAANVTSTGIPLDESARGDFVAECEALLTAPALTTGELADAATMKYDLITSDNADLSAGTTLVAAAITQTGAGGAGAAAATYRFTPPTNVKKYLGFKATNSGAGNASGKSGTLELLA